MRIFKEKKTNKRLKHSKLKAGKERVEQDTASINQYLYPKKETICQ